MWASEASENLKQSVDSSKNYLDGKEKELSTLNKVRSQDTLVLFPDNMDLSICNAIRIDELVGACSSLLVGLCWVSCRSSNPTSMFWPCPYSSLSTGKAELLTGAALTCRMSPFFLMDPSTFASHCWGQTMSSRAALAVEGLKIILARKSTKSGARRYLASGNLQKQLFWVFFCHLIPARDHVPGFSLV